MSWKRALSIVLVLILVAVIYFRDRIFIAIYFPDHQEAPPVEKVPLPELDPALKRELADYLKEHRQAPEQYILSKFKNHDIVFLGEHHRFRHDPLLVQRMVPLLYQQGIYNVGMEFATHRDQPLIDSLITAPQYDQSLANRILFNSLVDWGYQEYADIFKAAWKLNRQLPDSAPKFRIVGLNSYNHWELVQTEEDRRNPQILRKVFAEGISDSVMARSILNEFVRNGKKALIYCGIHHAFTRFDQPIVDWQKKECTGKIKDRTGQQVYQAIGDRVFMICLHFPWTGAEGPDQPDVYPVGGVIDALMKQLGTAYYPIGFDTRGTPFGELSCENTYYAYGHKHLTLQDMCDGYIFQKPFSQYRGVTYIKDFINENNMEEARRMHPNPNFKQSILWKIMGPAVINAIFARDADVSRWIRHLE